MFGRNYIPLKIFIPLLKTVIMTPAIRTQSNIAIRAFLNLNPKTNSAAQPFHASFLIRTAKDKVCYQRLQLYAFICTLSYPEIDLTDAVNEINF